ncbi:hypothetical protein ACNKHX_17670 [Shigella flexneri]
MDRVGTRYVEIDPKKIVAVVATNLPDVEICWISKFHVPADRR